MTPFIIRNKLTLSATLLVAFVASLWTIAGGPAMTPSTYAMLAALLIGLAIVALKTWKSGQATASMGQLLHETELSAAARSTAREIKDGARRQA